MEALDEGACSTGGLTAAEDSVDWLFPFNLETSAEVAVEEGVPLLFLISFLSDYVIHVYTYSAFRSLAARLLR